METLTKEFFKIQGGEDIKNFFFSVKVLAIPHLKHPSKIRMKNQLDQLNVNYKLIVKNTVMFFQKNYLEKELNVHQETQRSVLGKEITLSQWSIMVPQVLGQIIVGKPVRMGVIIKSRFEEMNRGLTSTL